MAEAKKTDTKAAEQAPQKKTVRVLTGLVVSDKMDKTVVVRVNRKVKHGRYSKYITRSQKYKAHDGENTAHLGDLVRISETRPLSKDKRWKLDEVVRKASVAAAVDMK